MSPMPGEPEMQTPTSQMMPCPGQGGTPAESVGSVWAPDAASVAKAPWRGDWPSNGFGRVLEMPQKQGVPSASLAERPLCSTRQCSSPALEHTALVVAVSSAGCADADVRLEVVVSKEAAADVCLANEQDGRKERSSAGEQQAPANLGDCQQQEVLALLMDSRQSTDSQQMHRPVQSSEVRVSSAAGGYLQEDSSAASSPCSSQLAYADAGSNALFTPVPLVDRLPVVTRSSLRLEQLPCPSPLPASCPATPAGQRRQPAPEEGTPVLFGRPASAGVSSVR